MQIYRTSDITNVRMDCSGLTAEEQEQIKGFVKALQRKRKRNKMKRLLFEIKFKNTIF